MTGGEELQGGYRDGNPFATAEQKKAHPYRPSNPFAKAPAPAAAAPAHSPIATGLSLATGISPDVFEGLPVIGRFIGNTIKESARGAVEVATRPTEAEVAAAQRGEYSPAVEGFAGKLGINVHAPAPEQERLIATPGDPGQSRADLATNAAQAAVQVAAPAAGEAVASKVLGRAAGETFGEAVRRASLARRFGAGALQEAVTGAPIGAAFDRENHARGAAVGAGLGLAIRGAAAAPGAVSRTLSSAFDVTDGVLDDAARAVKGSEELQGIPAAVPESEAGLRERNDPLRAANLVTRRVQRAHNEAVSALEEEAGQRFRAGQLGAAAPVKPQLADGIAAEQAARAADERAQLVSPSATPGTPQNATATIDALGNVVPIEEQPLQGPAPLRRPPLVPSVPAIEPRDGFSPFTTQVRKLDLSQGGRFVEDGMATDWLEPGMPLASEPSPGNLVDVRGRPLMRGEATDRLERARGPRTRSGAIPQPAAPEPKLLTSGEPAYRATNPFREPEPSTAAANSSAPLQNLEPAPAAPVIDDREASDARMLRMQVKPGSPGVRVEPHGPQAGIIKVAARDAEGQPIGILSLVPDHDAKTADVLSVYVAPGARRQGVATQLYDAAEQAGWQVQSGKSGLSDAGQAFVDARAARKAAAQRPALALTPEPLPAAEQQTSLLSASAGTAASRPLTTVEAAMRAELEGVRTLLARTSDPATKAQLAGRAALMEKLLNRGKAITADEMATRAAATAEKPAVADVAQQELLRQPVSEFNPPAGHAVEPPGTTEEQLQQLDQIEQVQAGARRAEPDATLDAFSDQQEAAVAAERARITARDKSGKLRKNLSNVSDEALADELLRLHSANSESFQGESVVQQESRPGEVPYVGKKRGAAFATGAAEQRKKSIAKIEAELERRGADVAQLLGDAGQRQAGIGPQVDAGGVLRDENGLELFAGLPVHRALKDPLVRHAAGATAGALYGYDTGTTPEDKRRRAVVGGLLGATGSIVADQLAGGVRSFFTKAPLSALAPETAEALQRAGALIDFHGNEAAAIKAAREGSFAHKLNRLADNLANVHGALERLGRLVEDKLAPGRNPRYLLSYFKASERTAATFYQHGIVDPISREVAGPSFKSLFEPFNGDDNAIRTALTYVKAKRDLGRGLPAFGGFQSRLDDARKIVAYGDGDPLLREFAAKWQEYVEGIGQYAVKSGLWTTEQWNAMRASDALYVPYKRLLDSPLRRGVNRSPAGTQLANVSAGVQKFHGSAAAVENTAEALAEYTAAIVRRADRYRVGASVFDAVDQLGDAGQLLLTRLGPGELPVKARAVAASRVHQQLTSAGVPQDVAQLLEDAFNPIFDAKNPVIWRNGPNGKEYGVVHAPDLMEALQGLNPNSEDGLRKLLDLTLRPLRRIFTATTTGLSPRFAMATNPMRDVLDLAAKSEGGLTIGHVARGYYEGILDLVGKSRLNDEAALAGVGGVSQFAHPANPAAVARRYAPTTKLQRGRAVAGQVIGSPLAALEKVGEASDKSPRLAEYLAALKQAQPQVDAGVWTAADARLYAATRARGVTIDFANKPGSKVLRALDDYIPFFGVALKAPVSFVQAGVRNPVRMLTASAGVAAAAAGAWAVVHALPDEARAKAKDRLVQERAGGVWIPLDQTGENFVRWQLSGEMGIIASSVTAGLDAAFERDPHAARLFAASIVKALPPGVGEAVEGNATGIVPIPGVQQIVENIGNKRAFTGMPVVPERMLDLPPAERRFDTTSPTYDLLAAGARAVGFDQVSPLQVENLARGVTSQATPFLTEVTDPIAAKVLGRERHAAIPLPVSRSPVNPASAVRPGPANSTESERDYYALRSRIEQANNYLNQLANAGAKPNGQLQQYATELHPQLQGISEAVDEIVKTLREQETSVRDMAQSNRITPDRARQLLDQIKEKRQRVYRRAVSKFRTLGLQP